MKTSSNICQISYRQQRGVVLVVALIMLVAMTAIGVATMSTATLQERMAGNNRQYASARLNAESALRQGERFLTDLGLTANEDSLRDLYITPNLSATFYTKRVDKQQKLIDFNFLDEAAWNDGNSIDVAVLDSDLSVKRPRFFINYIGRMDDSLGLNTNISLDDENKDDILDLPFVFRVTAIGYGSNEKIYSVLESTYMTQQGSP
jgi:type IV pilus assembly protein PilX